MFAIEIYNVSFSAVIRNFFVICEMQVLMKDLSLTLEITLDITEYFLKTLSVGMLI